MNHSVMGLPLSGGGSALGALSASSVGVAVYRGHIAERGMSGMTKSSLK
ncbi:MAG: hypothetical protein FD134_2661 [Gallionellaceae bacterium]|nr:MAG: hypothetical protein FD134_2661 [Gallionellaceae bacterium]